MANQFGITLRNTWLDSYESVIGASPLLRCYTGSQPADCATAASGTLLAVGTLPADWMANASAGSKAIANGPYVVTGQAAAGTGTAMGYFRIYDSTGTTCHHQGSITVTGGGGDMTVDNVSIANAQVMNATVWSLTAPGA